MSPDLSALIERGFEVEFHSHAKAILTVDFPQALAELEEVLLGLTIPIEEIVGSGGGETKGTQRLRRGLAAKRWVKTKFEIQKSINGIKAESISHEVDHVRSFLREGSPRPKMLALEIEWNNKDPFFDRDLENFKRLHAEGAISVGIVVTRGASLQQELRDLVRKWVDQNDIDGYDALEALGVTPTRRQKQEVLKRTGRERNPLSFRDAWTDHFVSDKFGVATTHWSKLADRVRRGVGNPCPLLLIGLPSSIVTFGEDPKTVAALIEEGAPE
jgi:Restriction endonuclease BglII